MAHDLNRSNMIYVGEVPWHGLGTALPRNCTWEEAKALLPFYRVKERQLFAAGLDGAIPDRKALVRDDTGAYVSTVGIDYGVVQFDDLAETVMRAIGSEAVIHTAGLMGKNGTRAWILGEVPEPLRVKNDPSEIRRFFGVCGSHDGTLANHIFPCDTRVVCRNTLQVALGENAAGRTTIRHTLNAAERLKGTADAFRALLKGGEKFGQLANVLADTSVTDGQCKKIAEKVLPLKAGSSDEVVSKVQGQRAEIVRLSVEGTGIVPAMRGSAWALYNGLTEWADHKRNPAKTSAAAFEASVFGPAAEVKRAGMIEILRETGISLTASGV